MRWLLAALLPLLRCVAAADDTDGLVASPLEVLPERVWRPPTPPLPLNHTYLSKKSPGSPHQPEQVHLTLAGPGAAAISWVTHPQEDAAFMAALRQLQAAASPQDVAAWAEDAANKHHHHGKRSRDLCKHLMLAPLTVQVKYGRASANYEHVVNGTFTCYWSYEYNSGALHHVVIGGGEEGPLAPNTTYFYRVGDPDRVWSSEFSFKTLLPAGPSAFPLRVAVIGDLGQTEDSRQTLVHAVSNTPDFVLNVGDLSYADGFQPRWDSYARLVEPFAATLPWMVLEGNHEKELINSEKTFLAYESRYYLPYRESGSADPLYYSFDAGPVHFLMLGSYADVGRGSAQYAWLLDDLASFDRAKTPWLVVAMHCPWYNSNTAHYGEGDEMQKAMEDTLYEHGADIVFSGHVHAYERMSRVYHNRRDECGPAHINIGDGGNWEGLDTKYLRQPKWSVFREPTFGHGMFTVANSTHAHWEWHRNSEGNMVSGDELWFVRNTDCNRAAGVAAVV